MENVFCNKEKLLCNLALESKKEMFELLKNGKSGHIGSSLSCIEILIVLHWMKYTKRENIHLIFSKGHAELGIYSVMKVFKLIDANNLKEYGSILQGHPSKRWIPEIEYSSGSLGQGLSYGIGIAISHSLDKTIVLLGDGEIQEGQIWEALIVAARLKLNNLYIIIDYNCMQLEGPCLFPYELNKFKKILENMDFFVEVCDGHNIAELIAKLDEISLQKPYVLIAKTIKGNGVKYMENNPDYHSKVMSIQNINEILEKL